MSHFFGINVGIRRPLPLAKNDSPFWGTYPMLQNASYASCSTSKTSHFHSSRPHNNKFTQLVNRLDFLYRYPIFILMTYNGSSN